MHTNAWRRNHIKLAHPGSEQLQFLFRRKKGALSHTLPPLHEDCRLRQKSKRYLVRTTATSREYNQNAENKTTACDEEPRGVSPCQFPSRRSLSHTSVSFIHRTVLHSISYPIQQFPLRKRRKSTGGLCDARSWGSIPVLL